ncbi:DNA repair protein Rad5 [Kwoniella heveanensis BCC8398]|uniref:DNA repair protein Rad5 n=1 Tax=Kwoniella heveanensis BCC8398 TaxID=1296120 RepID=A0A1B9GPC5_9TREE|nr:DNA repair protein Rad5 [Kwoniella heveanensis BCC8398]
MEHIAIQGGSSSSRAGPSTSSSSSNSSARQPAKSASSKRQREDDGAVSSVQVKREDEDDPPLPEMDEHFCTFRTDVVGVQYYRGLVGKGEYVMLRRQPNNQYDPNAVQVINAGGTQVGHIPRAVAGRLAELMDGRVITVEGRMVGQNLDGAKHYKMGMDLSIYARPSLREVLEPELAWALNDTKAKPPPTASQSVSGLKGSASSGVGLPGGDDPAIKKLLDGLTKVGTDQHSADTVMDSLTGNMDVSKLPLHASPPGLANGQLLVEILPHQSQVLQWMIERENPVIPKKPSDPQVQFWTRQSGQNKTPDYYLNVATRTPQYNEPELGRGGIIADGMGLGKTLTALSLVLATKAKKGSGQSSNATLIVCPLSVLSNWEKQIEDHVAPGQLTCYTYHGASKGVTVKTLESFDVVLTTYPAITADAPGALAGSAKNSDKEKKLKIGAGVAGPLLKVKWKRVVADEGHVLRNPKAKMTQAFASLQAERRWICTGTPIVNSSGDLGSLLTCLKICKPLDQPEYFKSLLLRPLKRGDPKAAQLLQALVAQILLRRTKDSKDAKGKKLVELPGIEYFRCTIKLDYDTRQLYDEILEGSRRKFQEAMRTGEGTANVLSMLTRIRQLCLSAELVPQSFIDDLRRPIAPAASTKAISINSMPAEKKNKLIKKLRLYVEDDTECGVCYDSEAFGKRPCITDCGHAFCYPCIERVLLSVPLCPMDRHPIGLPSILELPPDPEEYVDPVNSQTDSKPIKSAKIDELVKYLQVFPGDEKTLVFSQFTSFLDQVALRLNEEKIPWVRFDGRMNAAKRQQVVAEFQRPVSAKEFKRNPRVMLISLKSGAVGLNLTAASNVFLCDPWWQSAIEAQAVDRVHRMGQTKQVRVFQLIAEDTVESAVLDIQKRKDALVAKAFEKTGKETTKAKKEARFEELKELLGVH